MKTRRHFRSQVSGISSFITAFLFSLIFLLFPGPIFSAPTHDVGVRIYHWDNGSRMVPVLVWYPALVETGAKGFDYHGTVRGEAVYNAESDSSGSPYPLIVFSHGLGACGNQSVFYTENLAANGYIVAAPDHKDSAMCHIDGGKDIGVGEIVSAFIKGGGDLSGIVHNLFADRGDALGDPLYRPGEISFVIDKVLELSGGDDNVLSGMADSSRIGMTGHSSGGWTSMVVGGAETVCTGQESYCGPETEGQDSHGICCLDKYRGKTINMRDDRVKAILPLAPANMIFPNYEGISKIDIPVMIISGASKFEVDWEENVAQVYDLLSAPKYAIMLYKVDHLTVVDYAMSVPGSRLLPAFWNYNRKKEIYERYSEAFFNAYLKGDEEGLAYIRESHDKLVELTREVE